jgi:hypothetical protein
MLSASAGLKSVAGLILIALTASFNPFQSEIRVLHGGQTPRAALFQCSTMSLIKQQVGKFLSDRYKRSFDEHPEYQSGDNGTSINK